MAGAGEVVGAKIVRRKMAGCGSFAEILHNGIGSISVSYTHLLNLQRSYVASCRAFSAAFDGEGDFLTFIQGFVAIVLDSLSLIHI